MDHNSITILFRYILRRLGQMDFNKKVLLLKSYFKTLANICSRTLNLPRLELTTKEALMKS